MVPAKEYKIIKKKCDNIVTLNLTSCYIIKF